MTVGDYIAQLFGGFNISLNNAALLSIASNGISLEDDLDEDTPKSQYDKVMLSILKFAPMLMISPTSYSVRENGHSKSIGFNAQGFLKWYSLMCKQYGIKDELSSEKPRIKFL